MLCHDFEIAGLAPGYGDGWPWDVDTKRRSFPRTPHPVSRMLGNTEHLEELQALMARI